MEGSKKLNIFSLTLYFFISIVFFVLTTNALLHAQTSEEQLIPSDPSIVALTINPQFPEPFQPISLKITSFVLDLDRATVVWKINGRTVSSGVGVTTYGTTVGSSGSTTQLDVTIQSGGTVITKSLTIIPAGVDLLWEAVDSYTPLFYKGKALPASEATIRVVATPNLLTANKTRLDPNTLVYKWKRNNKFRDFNDQSGTGKSVVTFTKELLRKEEVIGVDVSSSGGSINASRDVLIPQVDPQLFIYEERPAEGIHYTSALEGTVSTPNREITILAEPFFISTGASKIKSVLFTWRVNNNTIIKDALGANYITLQGDGKGTSRVSADVKNENKLLQFTSKTFSIKIDDKSQASNLFGF